MSGNQDSRELCMEWLQNDGPGIVCHDVGLILLHNEVIPNPATFLDLWCKPRHTPVIWALWPSEAKELSSLLAVLH
jgi:hypothetical protein